MREVIIKFGQIQQVINIDGAEALGILTKEHFHIKNLDSPGLLTSYLSEPLVSVYGCKTTFIFGFRSGRVVMISTKLGKVVKTFENSDFFSSAVQKIFITDRKTNMIVGITEDDNVVFVTQADSMANGTKKTKI